ncbi:XdhC family protein [Natronorarus salvus]|uniref:XdhC family protein n=1 Tax=Natronorarus salvus TaxID=3117733 RepID=UPI002F260BFD
MGQYSRVDELTGQGETIALVTVTAVEGSAPRDVGTSMIVHSDGRIEGTIGGGTVEHLSKTAAIEAIEERTPRRETWELRPGGNTGMVCDGSMEVFINVLEGQRQLIVVGGGHIAVPVVRIGAELGYSPVVIEDRDEFATSDRFPTARIINANVEEGFDEVTVTSNTAIVIATRNSTLDQRAAKEGLQSDAFYVGCVASETKAGHIRDGLRDGDEELMDINELYAPIGLDLGAETPSQIALSILSEVEAVRTGATHRSHSKDTNIDESSSSDHLKSSKLKSE